MEKHLRFTVETTLSPNLAKSVVVDGGRLTTTSTICSPPLVVPQEGLSKEMKLSPPASIAVFEAKCCISRWTAIGLVIRGGLGSIVEAFRGKSIAEIVAPNVLVEDAELLVATCSKTASAGTVSRGSAVAGCRLTLGTHLEIDRLEILRSPNWQSLWH